MDPSYYSYAEQRGERNRTLTVIKARGTAHSNQMREVLLSRAGVTLAEVYSSAGDVLLGTARLRREQEEAVVREQIEQQSVLELRTLDQERDRLSKELDEVRLRLGQIDGHRAEIVNRTASLGDTTLADAAAVREARHGDPFDEASGAVKKAL